MKNVLLGSVAGLAMVGTAAAADLPVKAKAAEYVKICSTYGAGFYYIPGSDTCLKVGGFVQTDYNYQDYSALQDADYNDTYFLARGAIRLDARTQTEYGTLRSYIEYRLTYNEADANSPSLDKAYIQFAGFTFGKVQSFFDYYADNNVWGIDSVALTADANSLVAAYTADFGNGFTATISIEDDSNRSNGYYFTSEGFDDIGNDIPALVGNLNYEGEWGGFQVSAMVRQLDDANLFENDQWSSDDIGWAVLGGVKFNLNALGEGDTLYIEATYADGALGYTGIAGSLIPTNGVADVYFNPETGSYEAATAWTVAGELTHYFTPSVYGVLFGNYGEADIPEATWDAEVSGFTLFNVGASLNWTPVKGLLFVAQYTYGEANYDSPVEINDNLVSSEDFNQVILSVRRSF